MTRTPTRPIRRLASLACIACAAGLAGAAAPALAAEPEAFGSAIDAAVNRAGPGTPQAPSRALPMTTIAQQDSELEAVTGSAVLYDDPDDGYPAPDIDSVVPFTSDDGTFNVGIVLSTNALIEGDSVVTFVNTDGNAATGSPTFDGADVAVAIIGHYGQDEVATAAWDGSSFEEAYFASLVSFASGDTDEVWSIDADELGVAPGTRTGIVVGSMYDDGVNQYFDFAPEPGWPPLAFTTPAATPPPAPVTVAPRAPSPPSPATSGSPASGPGSSPVSVRSFAVTATPSGVRLRLGWVRGTGRVRWSVELSTRIGGRRVVRTTRGAGATGTRTVLRTVRLPGSWHARPVVARLILGDDARMITRTRTVW